MFLPIYSQHAERNTIIFSTDANLNALNWHIRPLNATILLFQKISILLMEETVVITKKNA